MSKAQTGLLPSTSNWPIIFSATFGGISAALHIGKAAATLPLIREEFGSDLTLLAAYVSLISVVAALTGMMFGTFTRRIGARRAGIIGLMIVAAGSALGALSPSVYFLLVTRGLEAIGFALAVTSMPAIIQPVSAPQHKSLALGIWATWMPLGVALMMAISWLVLEPIGWRGVFLVGAALPVGAAIMIALVTLPRADAHLPNLPLSALRTIFGRETVLMGCNFISFSAANMIVMGFLPTFLVDEFAMSPTDATLVSLFAALSLVPGNIAAGWLLDRGYSVRGLFFIFFGGMALFAYSLFSASFPIELRIISAFLFSACTGVPPAIIWASISRLARTPDEAPLLSGFYYQGAGIGQLLGPILAGIVVENFDGWFSAFWIILAAMVAGYALSAALPSRQH